MAKFKVGDRVQFREDVPYGTWENRCLSYDKSTVYTVHNVRAGGADNECIQLAELMAGHPYHFRYSSSFRLADNTSKAPAMILDTDPTERKNTPITSGVLDYFPLAIAEVAKCSKAGNDQHNPGQPLHWAKEKSTDHADCIARHLIDRGTRDTDGIRHSAKLAWRALANLQIELEKERAANAA